MIGTNNDGIRHNWVVNQLSSLPSGYKILDAGAGELQYKKYCTHLQYVSQDFNKYDGIGDNRGLQTQQWNQTNIDIISDIINIPRDDNSFDAIMCIEVFEHIPSPIDAIKEFKRLLRPGGKLILTAPFCSLTHFAPYHFYSGFNRYFYEHNLSSNGFKNINITARGNFFEYMAQEVRRLQSVSNKYSKCEFGEEITRLLANLEKASINDTGSDELLCYGYMVTAERE